VRQTGTARKAGGETFGCGLTAGTMTVVSGIVFRPNRGSSLVALHLVAQADCRKIARAACCGVRRFSCEIETDYFVEKRAILGHYRRGVVELCCDEDDQWSDGGDQPEDQDAVAPGLRFPRRRLFASHTLCAPRVKTQTCRMRRRIRKPNGRYARHGHYIQAKATGNIALSFSCPLFREWESNLPINDQDAC